MTIKGTRQQQRCSFCHQPGHNRKTCPALAGRPTEGGGRRFVSSLLCALCFPLLAIATAEAIDFTASGAILTVTYKEPTTNTDGSVLNDLAGTTVSSRVCPVTGTCSSAFTKTPLIPAVGGLVGGGNVSTTVTVNVTLGQEVNVEVFAQAQDTSGNVSPESLHVTKRVDRLSPAPPQ